MPRRPLQRETKLCILHAVLKRGNGWGKKHGLHSHSSSSRKTPQQLLRWWPREQRGRASLHKEKAQAQLSRVICLLESARKLSSSFGGASPVLLCIGTQTVQFAAHATVTVACQR